MYKFETRRKRTKWIEKTNPVKERRKKNGKGRTTRNRKIKR